MRFIYLVIISLLLAVSPSFATTMLQMNLEEMTSNAETIFRGELIDVSSSQVSVGGGEVSTLVYKFRVDELFKGEVNTVKDVQITEVQMVGTLDKQRAGKRMIPGFPVYKVGDEYLMFVATAGRTGLTTTMGLGQGTFQIYSKGKDELAVNEYGNVNLKKDSGSRQVIQSDADHDHDVKSAGPLPYTELANQIRTLVRQ